MMEFIDLKAQYAVLKDRIDIKINEVLASGQFIMGNEVREFEEKLAEYIGVKHAIACSDGTAALQLIYMAYGIGRGDAVFCPDMTFIASVEPACLLGATPVFCDIDPKTYNICADSLERQIKNVIEEGKLLPKAVIVVDFLGNPADYDKIRKMTEKYHLLLVEDAAQSMGAAYKGRMCGSLGDVAATSFFPSKPLGCYGDGGAVLTNDDSIAALIRSYQVHGKGSSKYDNVRIGINARLDTLQAAILLVKLNVLTEEIKNRQIIAGRYNDLLEGFIVTPHVDRGNISSYAQYVIFAESEEMRNRLIASLKQEDIPVILYYPTAMHRLPVFKSINCYDEKYINTIKYSQCTFGIPFSPYLTQADQNRIIKNIKDTLKKAECKE